MKAEKVREMSDVELETQIRDLEAEIWKRRFQAATGQNEGMGKLRSLRRDIARSKTILRERETRETHGS
jgi:large subunit ribosomal protein L29